MKLFHWNWLHLYPTPSSHPPSQIFRTSGFQTMKMQISQLWNFRFCLLKELLLTFSSFSHQVLIQKELLSTFCKFVLWMWIQTELLVKSAQVCKSTFLKALKALNRIFYYEGAVAGIPCRVQRLTLFKRTCLQDQVKYLWGETYVLSKACRMSRVQSGMMKITQAEWIECVGGHRKFKLVGV